MTANNTNDSKQHKWQQTKSKGLQQKKMYLDIEARGYAHSRLKSQNDVILPGIGTPILVAGILLMLVSDFNRPKLV